MLRGLVLPGQRRLHMKDESDQRRRSIATAIAVSGVTATIYDAGRRYRNERERRAACLHALVGDAARRGDAMLVLEQDDTLLSWDNQRLIESPARRAVGTPCATNTAEPPPNCYLPPPMPWPGAGPRAATGDDASNPSSPTYERSDRSQTSAKPERHGRPAGSRAHFLKLNATGFTEYRAQARLPSANQNPRPGRQGPDPLHC